MRQGSLIVDLAASAGGNSEYTKPDEEVRQSGVLILGPTNLPAALPGQASQLFSHNVTRFMLQFSYLLQDLFAKVRSFAFVADIGETTALFREHGIDRAVELAYGGAVINVYANSNYGHAFWKFRERFLDSVTSKTTVLVIGDGRNNYNPAHAPCLADVRRLVPNNLRPGGYLVLHDYYGWYDAQKKSASPVRAVIEQLIAEGQLEHILIDTGYMSFVIFRKPDPKSAATLAAL